MTIRLASVLIAGLLVVWATNLIARIVRWKAYIWLPGTARHQPRSQVRHRARHLIFTMVDHYEPGIGDRGVQVNNTWLETFRRISDAHRDSTGTCFRYSWFYPYDHKNDKVLIELCKMAYDGYGEVEMHWHHPPASDTTFPAMLREAIGWFQQYGALISSGGTPQSHFAFIHGNWALDNSLPICGVDHELQILFEHGCYADFTFSTIGTPAQPRKVNAIYYPHDLDGPKSYNDGVNVCVGNSVDDRPMIFQGPIHFDWLTGQIEYGAIEGFAPPSKSRIHNWIDTNIHVEGRPEWVFVKVYSHGVQSAHRILHHTLGPMLHDVDRICRQRGLALHYMTAREAYNVAKAAEAGKTGNPADFRDYRIPKPCNMLFHTQTPVVIERITKGDVVVHQLNSEEIGHDVPPSC